MSPTDPTLPLLRSLTTRGPSSPSDTSLTSFINHLRSTPQGDAFLNSLLEAKQLTSTIKPFTEPPPFKNKTPATAHFFSTATFAWLEVKAPEIGKQANGKVTVWPAGIVAVVTASGTLYYDELPDGPCGVTVHFTGTTFTAQFWRLEKRLGKVQMGNIFAVFEGDVEGEASSEKAFNGQGEVIWRELEKKQHGACGGEIAA